MVRARRFMALSVAVGSLALATSASADTVQVTTNLDNSGATGGCTLRDAATAMAAGPTVNACTRVSATGTDTITFAPSLSGQTITLGTAGEVPLSDPRGAMSVVGPGMGNLTVTESVADRVFHEPATNPLTSPVTVSGMTITGGHPPTSDTALGGCVLNEGTLTLSDVRVTGCTVSASGGVPPISTDAQGAAIGSLGAGTLTLSDSLVDHNHLTSTATADGALVTATGAVNAQGVGGGLIIDNSTISNNDATSTNHHAGAAGGVEAYAGVAASHGSFSISHSTISDNTATGIEDNGDSRTAGGLFLFGTGTIQLSTIVGNEADPTGTPPPAATVVPAGGIYNQGTLVIRSSTIARNGTTRPSPVSPDGANLFADNGSTTISNSLIAEPRGGGLNCQINPPGTATSGGFNDDYSPAGASCFVPALGTDLTSNPLLAGALANNGGPTQTLALQPNSPVVDKGSSGGVTDATHDQRGFTRPVDFSGTPNAAGGDGTDIGALEVQLACAGQATPSTSCSGPPSPPPTQPTTPSKKKNCKKKGKKASAAKKKCKKKK
jgi:hypothetical protein